MQAAQPAVAPSAPTALHHGDDIVELGLGDGVGDESPVWRKNAHKQAHAGAQKLGVVVNDGLAVSRGKGVKIDLTADKSETRLRLSGGVDPFTPLAANGLAAFRGVTTPPSQEQQQQQGQAFGKKHGGPSGGGGDGDVVLPRQSRDGLTVSLARPPLHMLGPHHAAAAASTTTAATTTTRAGMASLNNSRYMGLPGSSDPDDGDLEGPQDSLADLEAPDFEELPDWTRQLEVPALHTPAVPPGVGLGVFDLDHEAPGFATRPSASPQQRGRESLVNMKSLSIAGFGSEPSGEIWQQTGKFAQMGDGEDDPGENTSDLEALLDQFGDIAGAEED